MKQRNYRIEKEGDRLKLRPKPEQPGDSEMREQLSQRHHLEEGREQDGIELPGLDDVTSSGANPSHDDGSEAPAPRGRPAPADASPAVAGKQQQDTDYDLKPELQKSSGGADSDPETQQQGRPPVRSQQNSQWQKGAV